MSTYAETMAAKVAESRRLSDIAASEWRARLAQATADGAECATCAIDSHGPRHNASARCKSGGYAHCSCDTCF
jgi:hypothetical protein